MPILVRAQGTAGGDTAGSSPETWSFGTWWSTVTATEDAGSPDLAEMTTLANAAQTALLALFADTRIPFCNNVYATESRAYHYASAFPKPPAGVIGYSDIVPAAGTQAQRWPLQTAVAITFDTDGRDKPRFGRIYLPTSAPALGFNDQMAGSAAGGYLAAFAAYLDALDAAVEDAWGQDVRLIVKSWGTVGGPYKAVTGLRCGRVVDTQRRRRRSIPEDYVALGYPAP